MRFTSPHRQLVFGLLAAIAMIGQGDSNSACAKGSVSYTAFRGHLRRSGPRGGAVQLTSGCSTFDSTNGRVIFYDPNGKFIGETTKERVADTAKGAQKLAKSLPHLLPRIHLPLRTEPENSKIDCTNQELTNAIPVIPNVTDDHPAAGPAAKPPATDRKPAQAGPAAPKPH